MPSLRFLTIALLALAIFSGGQLAAAEQKKLLIIDSQDGEPYDSARVALLAELAAQGYTEGGNLLVQRFSAGNKDGLATRHLMTEGPKGYDVIFCNGTIANKAAQAFGHKNPAYTFVFCSITDPVGVGLLSALNQPTDSNFTGVAYPVSVESRLAFIKEVLPAAKKIGFIYANMPQSHSYVAWMKAACQTPAFSDLEIVYRQVEFVGGDKGHLRMTALAEVQVNELKDQVDVFLTPCDQLGSNREFAEMVAKTAPTVPLAALSENEVMQDWGAHFGVFPVQSLSGKQVGGMIARLFAGEPISTIIPTNPTGAYGLNLKRLQAAGIAVPQSALDKAASYLVK
jgi:putative ABC transport system substrate-binding protein